MAKYANVLLLSILLIAPLSSISQNLPSVGRIIIRGDVRCSLTGDENAPPVSGGTVALVCGDSDTTLTEAVTDTAGAFTLVLTAAQAALFETSDCRVVAYLPGGNCAIAPPDNTLTASIDFVDFIISGLIAIFNYATGPFIDETV